MAMLPKHVLARFPRLITDLGTNDIWKDPDEFLTCVTIMIWCDSSIIGRFTYPR